MSRLFRFFRKIRGRAGRMLAKGAHALIRPFPFASLTKKQWLYLPRLFSLREKTVFWGLLVLTVFGFFAFVGRVYFRVTTVKPAFGGTYREGLLRQPHFINPLYASANDTDRDLTELIFSGLIRYTPNGIPDPDLAESFDISGDGKTYTVKLRDGLMWHDETDLTADDVVFTVKTIQNPEYKSPYRQNWQGVLVEKLDSRTVRFTLKQAYAPFIENLTIGIIPQHLWEKVPPESAALSELNVKPVGSGPYVFDTFTRTPDGAITNYTLTAFSSYHHGRPHIKELIFSFYSAETDLIAAFRKSEIDGMGILSAEGVAGLEKTDVTIYPLRIPRVVALFMNEGRENALTDKRVRTALNEAIDIDAIIRDALRGAAERAPSPIPPGSASFNPDIPTTSFDVEAAKKLFAAAGWKDANKDGMLEKTEKKGGKTVTTPLKIEISTSDFPELSDAAMRIKDMWRAAGVDADVKIYSASELETNVLRPRAYQVLLFGEIFGHDPDPFAFWHTSQIKDPGLNVALYSNRKVDVLLEEARRTANETKRNELYGNFQKLVTDDMAAIFLFSPTSFYGIRPEIHGVAINRIALPHERFSYIETWYMKTGRGLK